MSDYEETNGVLCVPRYLSGEIWNLFHTEFVLNGKRTKGIIDRANYRMRN